MLTDERILDTLQEMESVSTTYIQWKYKLSFAAARKLQNKWAANEPKEPIFEEKFQKWQQNPPVIPKVVKKRFTAFRLGDRFFDTYQEFEKAKNER
jgi:hypothetical protein